MDGREGALQLQYLVLLVEIVALVRMTYSQPASQLTSLTTVSFHHIEYRID